jgi:hypothetical protein
MKSRRAPCSPAFPIPSPEIVNGFPSAQVEVANARVRTSGHLKRRPKGGEELQVDVIEYPGHLSPLHAAVSGGRGWCHVRKTAFACHSSSVGFGRRAASCGR